MSTDFVTAQPCTIERALELTGFSIDKKPEENYGRYGLTDGKNYVHANTDEEGLLWFTRYGLNDATDFVEGLEAEVEVVSEYDDRFVDFCETIGDEDEE